MQQREKCKRKQNVNIYPRAPSYIILQVETIAMFPLVLFTDGIYFICNSKNVTKSGKEYMAKYKNEKYTCRFIAQHSKYMYTYI